VDDITAELSVTDTNSESYGIRISVTATRTASSPTAMEAHIFDQEYLDRAGKGIRNFASLLDSMCNKWPRFGDGESGIVHSHLPPRLSRRQPGIPQTQHHSHYQLLRCRGICLSRVTRLRRAGMIPLFAAQFHPSYSLFPILKLEYQRAQHLPFRLILTYR
jgi:hypothetical protein